MQIQKYLISHSETGFFSKIITDYLGNAGQVHKFVNYSPYVGERGVENFANIIQNVVSCQSCCQKNRQVLVKVLEKQYHNLETSENVRQNIRLLLQENTYVIVTGHQTNLFTGPLYSIYKILSTINLAEQLTAAYPTYNFVPIFWMGSEDHDFAEINHIHLFGKKIEWQQEKGGATGRLSTKTLSFVLKELQAMLGNTPNAQKLNQLVLDAYQGQKTLAKATQHFVNQLFKQYGLVVLDQDDRQLKQLFRPILAQELTQRKTENLVQKTNKQLANLNYPTQAFVRPINIFYLTDSFRKRIDYDAIAEKYVIKDTDLAFSETELLTQLQEYPERFSPNVILRPVYQQAILPCLAYVGGGGELAYWMQLKDVFAQYNIHFPMLLLRNSVLWIDKQVARKMDKIGLTNLNIFKSTTDLINAYVQSSSDNQLDLNEEKTQLLATFAQILTKAKKVDATLEKTVLGETKKWQKAINNLEHKLLRAEKRKFETSIQQIKNIKAKLFPKNSLQERHDNFIAFYLKYGNAFIESLKISLNPLDNRFTVLVET